MHDLAVTAVQTQVWSQFLLQPCCLLSTVAWPPWSRGPVRCSAPSGVRSCGCFGDTSPTRGLTLFRMVSCRAGWRRFWTWPKNSARLRFSAAPRACDKPLHAAYHQSSFPGAGQRNCLRAVAWVAPGILKRASTPSTVGTVLEAATWQRRWRLWAVHVLVLCFSLSACIFP